MDRRRAGFIGVCDGFVLRGEDTGLGVAVWSVVLPCSLWGMAVWVAEGILRR